MMPLDNVKHKKNMYLVVDLQPIQILWCQHVQLQQICFLIIQIGLLDPMMTEILDAIIDFECIQINC